MARKLTKEELLKIELGDFYELADDTVKKKALANIREKHNVAGQAKAARATRTTKKTARAACDSPTPEKRPGRPRTNPEGSRVWGLRVTDQEREVIKALLDYLRKEVNFDWGFEVSVYHTMRGGYGKKDIVYQKHSDPDDYSMFE